MAKQNKLDARAAAAEEAAMQAAAAAAAAANEGNQDMTRSPSFSCQSYELFVGQEKGHDDNNKEMSTRSDGLDSVSEQRRVPTNPTKMRKVSAVSVLIIHESFLILDESESLFQSSLLQAKNHDNYSVWTLFARLFRCDAMLALIFFTLKLRLSN